MKEKDFNKKIASATKWSSLTEVGTRLISPVTNAILARLLVPDAFGVVATLTMVISFAEIFTDAGFQKYLVQHDFEDDADLDLSTNVAFWTNIIFSFLIWGVIVIFATPIAELVGSAGHEKAIIIISAEIPLQAFSSIQMARYRRNFEFKNLFVARMTVTLVPVFVTVPLAFVFRSYWALVIGTLAKDILNAVILTAKSKWKPMFAFSLKKLNNMLSFSVWTILENVTIWLSTNVGTFIVGTILGAYYLGLYKTTISTVGGYFNIIQGAILPVLFSALSRCQDDDLEFKNVYFRFQRMAALIVFPLGFGVFVYRELATLILLGNQWMETADFLGMRSLVRTFMLVFSYFNSEVFRSKGKPRLSAMAQFLYLLTLIPALIWSSKLGFDQLSVVGSVISLSLLLFTSVFVHMFFDIRFLTAIKNILPSLLAAAIMAFCGLGFLLLSDNVLWQTISICICALIYAIVMLIIPAGRKQLCEIPILKRLMDRIF